MHYRGKEIRNLETQVVTSSRQKLIEVIHQRYVGLGGEILFEHEYESDGERDIEDEKSYDLLYFGRIGLDF